MINHEITLKNYGNQPKTMKNHETTLKNHGNQPKTMKNHETTLKNHGNQQVIIFRYKQTDRHFIIIYLSAAAVALQPT